jgi:cell division protein FtsB
MTQAELDAALDRFRSVGARTVPLTERERRLISQRRAEIHALCCGAPSGSPRSSESEPGLGQQPPSTAGIPEGRLADSEEMLDSLKAMILALRYYVADYTARDEYDLCESDAIDRLAEVRSVLSQAEAKLGEYVESNRNGWQEVARLGQRIAHLEAENQQLTASQKDAQTTIQALRNCYADLESAAGVHDAPSHAEIVRSISDLRGRASRVTSLDLDVARLESEVASLRQDRERLEGAIRWALGEEGEFPMWDDGGDSSRRPNDGKTQPIIGYFWWRTELRKRAGLASRLAPPAHQGETPP